MTRIAGVLIALCLTALAAPAPAASLTDGDRAAIQAEISGQIDAFRRGDNAAAYSHASPTIQTMFPTVDGFTAMVVQGYQPVYNPSSVTFGPLTDSPAGPLQDVFVTGPDGRDYIAVYTMQQQPDGSWKINGCSLTENHAPSI